MYSFSLKLFIMKKTLFAFAGFLLLFASCAKSTNGHLGDNNDNEAYDSLKEQLVALNTTLPQRTEEMTRVRWWKYLLVAAADAGGFFLAGGAGTGAVAVTTGCTVSTLVWDVIKGESKSAINTKASLEDTESFSINDAEIALSCVDGPGLVHNKVIYDLYEDNGEALFDLSKDELLPLVAEKVSIESDCTIEKASLLVSDQLDVVEQTVDAYVSSATIDEFVDKIKLSAPDKAVLLEVVNLILEGFDSIDAVEDNGRYCSSVQKIISESEISSGAKEMLVSTVSVANASARLWKIE